ncbi:MAG: DUF2961 domain-containing protein [Dokdonella sp.]
MRVWILLLIGTSHVGIGVLSGNARAAQPWQIWTSPAALAELDASDQVLEVSSRCPDGCRFDRSNAGPEASPSNPFPLRWIYQDGQEAVIFDQRGAGVVTRIWLTSGDGIARCIDPAMRVRFYVDGSAIPALDKPLAQLFDGTFAPFTPPLVADHSMSAGGYASRVPIAWQQSLRISLLNWENGSNPCVGAAFDGWNPLWYQIQFHRLSAGRVPASFDPALDHPAFRSFIAHAGDDPWNGLLASQPIALLLAPATTTALSTQNGSGWLRGIRLSVPNAQRASVRLRIRVDGESTVDLRLTDFFAIAQSAELDARSVLTGVDAGGTLYAWWPMPYRQSLSVELVAEPDLTESAPISGALVSDPSSVAATAGVFRATVHDQCASGGDVSLYAAGGAGKLVGVSARMRADGVVNPGYLEGDERAYADGMTTPIWYGTGVEDFFDGGFYFHDGIAGVGPFANAMSGATEVDRDGAGMTAAYRLLLTDALPYANGLRITLESGYSPDPGGAVASCLRHVTYAYTQARASAVRYQQFDLGMPSALAHNYGANGTSCTALVARFDDEPATMTAGTVCRGNGSRTFRFNVGAADQPLRLRRLYDVGNGTTGVIAGAGAALIRINGVVAGSFSPASADTTRRWQQQDAALTVSVPASGVLDFEIVPDSTPTAAVFSDAGYELIGAWRDHIFDNGFDDTP